MVAIPCPVLHLRVDFGYGPKGRLIVVDPATGEVEEEISSADGHTAQLIAASPAGDRVAWGSFYGKLRLAGLGKGSKAEALKGHRANVTALLFSPDGSLLVTGDQSGRLIIRDAASGSPIQRLKCKGAVSSLIFSDDSETLAAASGAKHIRFWNASSGTKLGDLRVPTGVVGLCSMESGHLLVAQADTSLAILDCSRHWSG